jgi:hypothetical protein
MNHDLSAPPGSPARQLVRHLTFAEGVAALWSLCAAISVGVVSPFILLPKVVEILPIETWTSTLALAMNPWLGAFAGAAGVSVLGVSLFWPMPQQVGRTLLILSLVISLSCGCFVSWAIGGAMGL